MASEQSPPYRRHQSAAGSISRLSGLGFGGEGFEGYVLCQGGGREEGRGESDGMDFGDVAIVGAG